MTYDLEDGSAANVALSLSEKTLPAVRIVGLSVLLGLGHDEECGWVGCAKN